MSVTFYRRLAIGIAAASLCAALPTAASATDYCVLPNVGCGGTNATSLESALDKADDAPGADRIFLGAFEYAAPTTAGFDYSKADAPVEIVGKGAGQTILTAPSGASGVLRLFGSASSSVHDLRIRIPANAAYGFTGLATDGTARRIDVVEESQQQYERQGVHLENGGALEDASVTLAGSPGTTAVWFDAGGGAVRRSTISAYLGLASRHGGTIERSRFVPSGIAIVAGGGVTTVTSSFMYVAGQPGVGLYANPQPGSPATIDADGLTIAGPGHSTTRAAMAGTTSAPAENAQINLTNSIIRGSRLEAYAAGTGQARIAISYSDHPAGTNELVGAPNGSITEANVSDVGDAMFVDQPLGDYGLLPASPLIDAGDPDTAQGSDMDGKPLVTDGDHDGIARRDMGAFELEGPVAGTGSSTPPVGSGGGGGASIPADTQAPVIGGFRASPSLFALARAATPVAAAVPRGTQFRYTLSEPARVVLRVKRARPGRRSGGRCVAPSPRLRAASRCLRYTTVGTLRRAGAGGANRVRFTGRIGRTALRPGRYRAVIVATDQTGNRSVPRRAAFRIAAP